ncbi:MAG: septal ring lytic transglycosylase RlpA family protein [Pseudomonadota bacterium]
MQKVLTAVSLGLFVSACASLPVLSHHTTNSADGTVTTASWYQCCSTTANGERFNPDGLTAAHRTLAFGTRVRVTNLSNNRSVTVRINDRGPFIRGRGIDLSRGAARQIGCISSGTCRVSYQVL